MDFTRAFMDVAGDVDTIAGWLALALLVASRIHGGDG